MTQIFIQLAMSVTGAIITVVVLLIVAGVIGYFTAWFYAKSVFLPIIKGLEDEKADLKSQIVSLKDDVVKLNRKSEELNAKIAKLEEIMAEKDNELNQLRQEKENE
jgi:hypothetical protein